MSETTQIILAVVGTSATALGVLVGILAFLYRIQGRQIGNVQISLSNLNARIDSLYHAIFTQKDQAR